MKRILHLSDLHITSDMPLPEANPFITDLLHKIKQLFPKINVIVFTGDLIDSKKIMDKIENEPSNRIEELWNKEASLAFELGIKYLKYIKKELNVSDKNIVVCVGNHDVNRKCTNIIKLDCNNKNSITYENRFDVVKKYYDEFLSFSNTEKTHFKQIEGFNFLVLNSNWNDGNEGKMCINCSEIEGKLKKHHSIIQNFDKNLNILVSHSPISAFCEEARYQYKENNYSSLIDTLNEYFGVFLAGDKHTRTYDKRELIAGAPTFYDELSYGIYEYSHDLFSIKHLTYKNSKWNIEMDKNSIRGISAISKNYLKQSGMDILFNIKDINIDEVVSKLYIQKDEQWKYFDELFVSFTTLRKTEVGSSGRKISVDVDLLDKISDLINESSELYPMVLRGLPKIGKSLFLTLLYLDLLQKFSKGKFQYVPVYFNLDSVIPILKEKEWSYIEKCVDEIFDNSKIISEIYNKPVCFLFDGLNKYKFFNNCIEDYIQSKIQSNRSFIKETNKFVICFDIDDDLDLAQSEFNRNIESDYVLYFNPVNVNNVHSNQGYYNFLKAFSQLYSDADENIINKNVTHLNLHSIDLNTLLNFKKYFIANDNAQCCITDLYSKYAKDLFGAEFKSICYACYELYYGKKTYDKIIDTGCTIDYSVFQTIIKQKKLAMYMIAHYYVDTLESCLKNNKKRIDENSVLNQCFNYEISNFIRGIMIKNNLQRYLVDFNEKYFNQLSYRGKAMVIYLVGRMNFADKELSNTLIKSEKSLKNIACKDDEDKFFLSVAYRSMIISKIAGLSNYHNIEDAYIQKLLSDKYSRHVNREFYLLYYGDRKNNEISFNYPETLYEGFDFYNVFNVLATKLNNWKENPSKHRLLRIEIFTLCDLIQQRIDHSLSLSRNNRSTNPEKVLSFFYNEKYIDKAKTVLRFIISTINTYLNFETNKDIFTQYLITKLGEYKQCLTKIENKTFNVQDVFSDSDLYYQCSGISKVEKTGWKVKNICHHMDDSLYEKLKGQKGAETVVEHIYDCYLIGLFYLPNTSQDRDYNKQKILNLLLIHDIGESIIGDYPPFYYRIDEKRLQEDSLNKKIFLSGLHDGIADLTEYLKLWNGWSDNDADINVQVAKEIDKIQMIYKMLMLLTESRIQLSKKRIESFLQEKEKIKTSYGIKIYDTLIRRNEHFSDSVKELVNHLA